MSTGFFLLPGLAAAGAGADVPIGYVIAGLLIVPGLMCTVELTTAMPRAGGIYFFLDRSMGSLMGTIGGFGTWIALVLKSAFALIGVGAYLRLFFPTLELAPLAAGIAILFGVISLFGAKKSTSLLAVLVVGLLSLLAWFIGLSLTEIELRNLSGMADPSLGPITYTASLVIISYMGLTKVASVAEEVRNPERNLALGTLLGFITVVVIFALGTVAMIGVVGAERLANEASILTPAATVARHLVGEWGVIVMTVAAVLAFWSVANAGILSASRYPLAMGRDHVLPRFFRLISRRRTPTTSTYVTVGMIVFVILVLDPLKIAKLAGAFMLLIFALTCLAVIVMRESHIESYDPGFRSPLYPWLHIVGMLAPLWLISQMGTMSILFTIGLVVCGTLWHAYYARHRVKRVGAIRHVFERIGRTRYEGLDRELRNILKEKGLRTEDPFEQIVARSFVIDLEDSVDFDGVVALAAESLEHRVPGSVEDIAREFLKGTRVGATPVTHGVALPHLRIEGLSQAEMALVRSQGGVVVPPDEFHESDAEKVVHALFFLVSPDADPGQHLRILAQIAERVDDEGFMEKWLQASDDQELREILLRDDRFLSVRLTDGQYSSRYIGKSLRELQLPEGALVALIRRGSEVIVPRGSTELAEGDTLTVIGEPETIRQLGALFS